jgi:hypothetical protein
MIERGMRVHPARSVVIDAFEHHVMWQAYTEAGEKFLAACDPDEKERAIFFAERFKKGLRETFIHTHPLMRELVRYYRLLALAGLEELRNETAEILSCGHNRSKHIETIKVILAKTNPAYFPN